MLSRRAVGLILAGVAFRVGLVVAFAVALAVCTGCAHNWAPKTAVVVLSPTAPPCAEWSVVEAWAFLAPGMPLVISRGSNAWPVNGQILIDWRHPREGALGLTWALGTDDSAVQVRHITRAKLQLDQCQLRLISHELGHALGLPNVDSPGRLMHWLYPAGGYKLTWRERRIIRRRGM